jgi:tRNA1(Val) A37 N6-methylase TrmN6
VSESDSDGITRDAILGGRLVLYQPARGYRAAIDPVLLAAALPDSLRGRLVDLGCGVGTAGLCVLARLPSVSVVGVERDPALAALARRNAAANSFEGRMRVITADIAAAANKFPEPVDAVIANPPYLELERANPVNDPRKATSTIEETPLGAWFDAIFALLKPKGRLAMIHRADRLSDILGGLGGRAGDITVFPLWPRTGEPAKRLIVIARAGVRTPLTLAAGLVLHEPDGRYTPVADAVLRGAPLPLA